MVDEVINMKEFPNESNKKWTRIFKKKWFFPALYIMLAAFLLTGVIWYQTSQSNVVEEGLEELEQTDSYQSNPFDEKAESVIQQQETIKMPVGEDVQTEIVTKFYDYNADPEDQEKGVTYYNNRYYQSTGVDIASSDGESFDVLASLSGTVEEVKEDPLLGNVVVMSHGDEVTTYYASLEEVTVEEGATINQGEKIGTAGKNLFNEESGVHVHFEIRVGDVEVDPEKFFNEPFSKLAEYNVEEEMVEEEMDEPTSEENSEEEAEEETNSDDETTDEEDEETNQDLSFSIIA